VCCKIVLLFSGNKLVKMPSINFIIRTLCLVIGFILGFIFQVLYNMLMWWVQIYVWRYLLTHRVWFNILWSDQWLMCANGVSHTDQLQSEAYSLQLSRVGSVCYFPILSNSLTYLYREKTWRENLTQLQRRGLLDSARAAQSTLPHTPTFSERLIQIF